MGVDSGAVIKSLNKTCVNSLQAAAGLCLSRTNYSVEIEHWLLKLTEVHDSDLTRIFRHFEVNTAHLQRDLTKALDRLKTGNARTPTLSPSIDELIRSAWVLASLQYQSRQVRSGFLLLALLEDEQLGRLARDASSEFAKIKVEILASGMASLIAGSAEEESPAAAREAGAQAAPARGVPTQTPALDQYTINLTERARAGQIDPVLGRDAEVRQMVDILIRRRQNNPILTGEAGVGKTAVVEGLAVRIAAGDVPEPLRKVVLQDLRPRPAPGRGRGQGRVRESAQAGDRRGEGVTRADRPLHRRSPHDDRRRGTGRSRRCGQPAQAGPGPRRAPHDRGDDLGRVQEILREGCGPGPTIPGDPGRGAERGKGHRDDAWHYRHARDPPRRSDPGGGRGRLGQALGPLYPRPAASRQVGEPARHRLRPRRDRPVRDPAGRRGLPPPDR